MRFCDSASFTVRVASFAADRGALLGLAALITLAGCHDKTSPSPTPSAGLAAPATPSASAAAAGSSAARPGAAAWREVERLAIDARGKGARLDGDEVGSAVALSGGHLIAGAVHRARDDGASSGAVVLQRGSPSKVLREHREKGEQLGLAVAVSGDDVLVGAPFASGRQKECGALFAYEGAGAASKLIGSGVGAGTGFGARLAVSGATAVVGHFGLGEHEGAWLFSKGKRGWAEIARLRPRDAGKDKGGGFGGAVAIDGDRVVIGGQLAGVTAKQAGSLWVFERSGGAFRESARIEPTDAREYLHFGAVVAVSGDTIVASAGGVAPDTVYVFSLGADRKWLQTQRLVAPGGAKAFGDALAISGDDLLIGAKQEREGAGVVYVYARTGAGAFAPAGELAPREPKKGAWFGASIALDGGSALVGAPLEDDRAGAVYLFAR